MKTLLVIIACLSITGCASGLFQSSADARYMVGSRVDVARHSVHFYAEQLARQLFLTSKSIKLNQTVAVGTFLPIIELGGKKAPPANVLGLQLQESFVTLSTQAGLSVVEFKTAKSIEIQKTQDVMLSRKVSNIDPYINTDYYLTGTHSYQEQGVVVNVRLIEVSTRNVIAAATDVIPTEVVWGLPGLGQSKNAMANNHFYHFSN